jgi:hypothetical protein
MVIAFLNGLVLTFAGAGRGLRGAGAHQRVGHAAGGFPRAGGHRVRLRVPVAGLITLVLLIDVFVFALGGQSILSYGRMVLVLIIGLIAPLVGGYFGERVQSRVEGAGLTT